MLGDRRRIEPAGVVHDDALFGMRETGKLGHGAGCERRRKKGAPIGSGNGHRRFSLARDPNLGALAFNRPLRPCATAVSTLGRQRRPALSPPPCESGAKLSRAPQINAVGTASLAKLAGVALIARVSGNKRLGSHRA